MNRIEQAFANMGKSGEKAFVPFLVAGDPDPGTFTRLARAIEPYADIIELGIPYTDPIADGPVIQAADARALNAGVTFSKACDLVESVRKFSSKPIVILTYANVVGVGARMVESLVKFARAGVDGIIIADVPSEEAAPFKAEIEKHGMVLVSLVAPTTSNDRMASIAKNASGFLYLVAIKGVTGARASVTEETATLIQRAARLLGKNSKIPICVGFGISTPEHVREILKLGAHGVIVGSAIIDRIGKNTANPEKMIADVTLFVKEMKDATKIIKK
nr:tryptophan synthase subunit alpha [Candidatus Sigynarchaeota archaeon]